MKYSWKYLSIVKNLVNINDINEVQQHTYHCTLTLNYYTGSFWMLHFKRQSKSHVSSPHLRFNTCTCYYACKVILQITLQSETNDLSPLIQIRTRTSLLFLASGKIVWTSSYQTIRVFFLCCGNASNSASRAPCGPRQSRQLRSSLCNGRRLEYMVGGRMYIFGAN